MYFIKTLRILPFLLCFLVITTQVSATETGEIIKAAEAGDYKAQGRLGGLYYMGMGVEKDLVSAYFWLSVAERNGSTMATRSLAMVKQEMTPDQIKEAEKRVAAWSAEHTALAIKTPKAEERKIDPNFSFDKTQEESWALVKSRMKKKKPAEAAETSKGM